MINVLYLDPTNDDLVILILFKGNKVFKIEKKYRKPLSEVLLLTLDELLKKSKTRLDSLKCLAIVSGPGSFSSLRVAVVLVNTLAWSLKIPAVSFRAGEIKKDDDLSSIFLQGPMPRRMVLDLLKQIEKKACPWQGPGIKSKKFKPIIPFYGREPNITKPKKKRFK
jgi:hypothetical protein